METKIRKWYQKKRYIIPGLFFAFIVFLVSISDSPETNQIQNLENNPTQPEVKTNIEQTSPASDSISQPENVKTEEQKTTPPPTSKPAPSPTPSFKLTSPTPTPTPAPTPTSTVKQESNCNSNYSGCVPIAADVDCAGGTGDGPAYVKGPVYVLGTDVYKLDGNKDGVACE